MTINVTAFRHTGCEDLGSLAAVLKKAGANFRYIDAYCEDFSDFNPLAPDLVIVLGGAPGAYQDDAYPFIGQEMRLLEKRIAKDLPTLGICLGAQIMAKALGARVYIGEKGPEKGWYDLDVNEAGEKTPVRHLDRRHTKMLQWHGDTFDLPEGARLLASTGQYPNQAFACGNNVLALQCHPEVTHPILSDWMTGNADKVAAGTFDIQKVREETAQYLAILTRQTEKFFLEWLQQIRGIERA